MGGAAALSLGFPDSLSLWWGQGEPARGRRVGGRLERRGDLPGWEPGGLVLVGFFKRTQ